MSSASNGKEKATEVGTTRLEPWLHSGVATLAKFQNTSVSAKIAQYTEEGFRREINSTDFNALVAKETAERDEAAESLVNSHAAVMAMLAKRKEKQVEKDT